MNVGITGASGFVGGAAARAFADAGWTVAPLGRREARRYDLNERVDPAVLAGLDVLVHAAYASNADNVAAVERLLGAARSAKVRNVMFISSLAASANAASKYGRDKYRAEAQCDLTRDAIVRPGLVAGRGGVYGAMRRSIVRSGIAPVFGDGAQPVYLVAVDELARAIVALAAGGAAGRFICAAQEPIAFADLCAEIGAAAGRRTRRIRVPVSAVLTAVTAAERIGLRLPLSSETVRGIANLRRETVPHHPEIGFSFAPPHATIRRVETELQ